MGGRRFLTFVVLAAMPALLATSSCGLLDRQGGVGAVDGGDLAWAGFSTTEGLELLGGGSESGIDDYTKFLLRGSPQAVDAALASAEFTAAPERGVLTTDEFTDGYGENDFSNAITGEDKWTNEDGQVLSRIYVRGSTSDGNELLQVWAFTT